ncbi:MAG: glycosyltransferase [Patescibacteria group bacterium]
MRVALVHDYLTQLGGAERVLLNLMRAFPYAPVFTLAHDPQQLPEFSGPRLKTSFLQRIPGARRHHRYFPLLMPLAVEQFDLSDYDVVLSASHSFGKGVVTSPQTLHISYCFTPTRYVWDDSHRYVREFSRSRFFQRLAPLGLSYIRIWDYYASARVDSYLTLSRYVAQRIKKYYHRAATVIAPPVEVDRFTVSEHDEGYYLVVSRLVPYKRIEIAIEACERLGRRLKVAGTGPEAEVLKTLARQYGGRSTSRTEFLGFVPDAQLPALYAGAKALLFPQEEDFGITPLEAAASGKPTIAYGAGGALETIIPNVTGMLFYEQSPQALSQAITASEQRRWERGVIRAHAERYRPQVFMDKITEFVHTEWLAFRQNTEP